MGYSVGNFVGPLVGLMISAIILGAMLSIFGGITMPEGYAYGDVLAQVFDIIPLESCNLRVQGGEWLVSDFSCSGCTTSSAARHEVGRGAICPPLACV